MGDVDLVAQQTAVATVLPDADDIISEFLGQINANMDGGDDVLDGAIGNGGDETAMCHQQSDARTSSSDFQSDCRYVVDPFYNYQTFTNDSNNGSQSYLMPMFYLCIIVLQLHVVEN